MSRPKPQYLNEVPEIQERGRRSYWAGLLEEFAKRSEKCMVLEHGNNVRDAQAAAAGLRYGNKNGLKVRVVLSDCTVYVIKEDGDEAKAR